MADNSIKTTTHQWQAVQLPLFPDWKTYSPESQVPVRHRRPSVIEIQSYLNSIAPIEEEEVNDEQ